jgi:hypothetical protein
VSEPELIDTPVEVMDVRARPPGAVWAGVLVMLGAVEKCQWRQPIIMEHAD